MFDGIIFLMQIKVIEPIGECFGVKNIIDKAGEIIETFKDRRIFIFGSLVHNKKTIEPLLKSNVILIPYTNNIEELNSFNILSEDIVIFSAHGHTKKVDLYMRKKTENVYDFTCPIVKKNILEVINTKKNIIYLGDKNHEESKTILNLRKNVYLVDSKANFEINNLKQIRRATLISQTTLSKSELATKVNEIKSNIRNLEDKSGICNETSKRQDALISEAPYFDIILILGEKISSNTSKLFEIASNFKNAKSFLISDIRELNNIPFNKEDKVLIASGTSCSQIFAQEVISELGKISTKLWFRLSNSFKNIKIVLRIFIHWILKNPAKTYYFFQF